MQQLLQSFLRKHISKEEIKYLGSKPIMLLNKQPFGEGRRYSTDINLLGRSTEKILIVEPTEELETRRTCGNPDLSEGMIIDINKKKSVRKLVKILWVKDFLRY